MEPDVRNLEIDLLIETIDRRYGYDFRHYARASIRRRVARAADELGVARIADLVPLVLHDESAFARLVRALTVKTTEMFRDPFFYAAFREHVVPFLQTFAYSRLWHAGCATGEEVYSTAIVLHEEGLLDRVQVYATDIDEQALEHAQRGIFELGTMRAHTSRYIESGARASFSDYYHAGFEEAKMADFLKQNITFARHNLATDGVFAEVNVVVCRNVLIYFDRSLQDRVLCRFAEALSHRGFLCLGTKESPRFSSVAPRFELVDADSRIYRRTP